MLKVGLPRNDALANYTEECRSDIRKRLGIPDDDRRKIILYCPTFREYSQDSNHGVVLLPPMNLDYWKSQLKADYILLFRAHYEVSRTMKIFDDDFVRDMTSYPVLDDLMIVSDILISDYSSIFFDYSIMDKCMMHLEYVSGSSNEEGVISLLKSINYGQEVEKTRAFRNKFVNYYGKAAAQTVDYIANRLGLEGDCR